MVYSTLGRINFYNRCHIEHDSYSVSLLWKSHAVGHPIACSP